MKCWAQRVWKPSLSTRNPNVCAIEPLSSSPRWSVLGSQVWYHMSVPAIVTRQRLEDWKAEAIPGYESYHIKRKSKEGSQQRKQKAASFKRDKVTKHQNIHYIKRYLSSSQGRNGMSTTPRPLNQNGSPEHWPGYTASKLHASLGKVAGAGALTGSSSECQIVTYHMTQKFTSKYLI